MASRSSGEITQLLTAVRGGDENANSALAELVYDELIKIARNRLRRERPDHTLQPTALVNEAYVKLLGAPRKKWQGRGHFFASVAQVMHRILIDHSRAAKSQKRGGDLPRRLPLDTEIPDKSVVYEHVAVIQQALTRLQQFDPRQGQVVQLRIFEGLTEEQVARTLGMSERTVKRDWNMALAFLQSEMTRPALR